MVLIPEVIDRSLRMAPDAVGVFQRLTWESGVPRQGFDVAVETQWVSRLEDSFEVGILARAMVSGRTVAQNLTVLRMAGKASSWGEREIPPIPSEAVGAPFTKRRSVVITEAEVRSFNRLAGTTYPAHDDRAAAWKRGYPDMIVQGALLVLAQMHIGGVPDRGETQMWFRSPVPVGSVLEVGRCETEESLWRFQMLGSAGVAAVGSLCSG
jgi:acyl dehydratase